MNSARRAARSIVGIAILASLVTGCVGASQGGRGSERVKQTAVDVMDEMRSRYQMHDGAPHPYDSVTGLLDNTLYQRGDDSPLPLTDAVVVGTISAVEPGRGFRIEGDDAPDGIETNFEDSRALWRTVHVSVIPESVVSGNVDASPLLIGFAFDASTQFDAIEEEFRSLGRVLLFLSKSDAVFDYDPSVHGIWLTVQVSGSFTMMAGLSFPFCQSVMKHDSSEERRRSTSSVPRRKNRSRSSSWTIQGGPWRPLNEYTDALCPDDSSGPMLFPKISFAHQFARSALP